MTFKDLEFKPHKLGKGIQAELEINPQVFVSVIAGEGFYSTGKNGVRKSVKNPEEVSTFEVGIIDENLSEEDQQWEVMGFQNREDINEFLATFI
tara:strand:+ start:229 stop:510 length:282 start_codon:yes stop_codon:yes gene_type:complete